MSVEQAGPFPDPGDVGLAEYVLPIRPGLGGRVALVDHSRGGPRRWTYTALAAGVADLAAHLRDIGVTEDDVVAVLTENSAEFVLAYHGVLAAGGVVLPLDPRDEQDRWSADLARCGAVAIVAEESLWAAPPLPTVVPGESTGRATTPPEPVRGGDRAAVLMSSSGTLGVPKKVVVTHRNLAAGLAQIRQVHRIGDGEVVACCGPLRHVYGMQMAMNATLRAGGTLVIGPTRFDTAAFPALLHDTGTAIAYLVPTVVGELGALTDPVVPRALRLVVSGGAPLPTAAATAFEARFGLPVVQGFGMTEAGCVSFTPDGHPTPAGTVGVVLPGTEARFVDPATGRDAVPGELWLRGPQIAPRYLDGPPLRDTDGWFRTGDLARLDPDGHLRIVGRLKSLIKYKGYQVSPAEVEDVLLHHPRVTDALVVGVPDPIAGELPKAYVVVPDAVPLGEITAHVAAKLAPQKRVRLVERVRAIPRSATGKPLRPPAQRVLVTGGGRGLGRDFAAALAAAGATVLVVGRDRAELDRTVELGAGLPGTIECAAADVTDPATLTAAVALGDVDVLVNNAGVPGPIGPTWTTDPGSWWRTFEVNLRGADNASRAVLPGMIARGGGRVVNVVSRAGKLRWPHASAYAVSKAALIALTANLEGELRGTGVTTVAFDPGLLDTGMTRAHLDRGHVGDPHADGILDFTLRARDDGGFTPVPAATAALVRIAMGAADHLSGRYVTADEV
ncbi:SDR family NAD(P)-dependent oxidoreductase [Saccharothrix longispora]|uniref:Acyl-CoA synthetase (AMP-forming)/AMP-acid ligase II/NAD(P)-dependent dehydrogenase (Short-subunit alcohol dehydrogenase family) n=1 Tax=Saccharothrix longispora TaxID=33920 RepID=A0ABU1PS72_9PSEU|nr:SDR family NAD(P)-dependent oxidoreductase [Saccharothrix longispora]MDR6593485.1 acyl-CoA synthetase (AMP-forming)/AMP-acid ligase II/NAD(P)-dependent dehydrogenase (short-subunit alcohol dehydrogenase family) [Saccharothrix longispora]